MKQRASKATHMEHINPKKNNRQRQTRTHTRRDPNEQSDDMNPKKKDGKRKRYYSSPKSRVSIKQQSSKSPTRTRPERKKRSVYLIKHTLFLNPHPKSRGGVGRSDREPDLLCAFPARFGRAVTAWSACT